MPFSNTCISYSVDQTPEDEAGIIQNLKLIEQHYPGIKKYVYYHKDISQKVIDICLEHKQIIIPQQEQYPLEVNKFYAFNDKTCRYVLFRKANHRISLREVDQVKHWMKQGHSVHIMRDHPIFEGSVDSGCIGFENSEMDMNIIVANFDWSKNTVEDFLKENILNLEEAQHVTSWLPNEEQVPFNIDSPYFVGQLFDKEDRAIIPLCKKIYYTPIGDNVSKYLRVKELQNIQKHLRMQLCLTAPIVHLKLPPSIAIEETSLPIFTSNAKLNYTLDIVDSIHISTIGSVSLKQPNLERKIGDIQLQPHILEEQVQAQKAVPNISRCIALCTDSNKSPFTSLIKECSPKRRFLVVAPKSVYTELCNSFPERHFFYRGTQDIVTLALLRKCHYVQDRNSFIGSLIDNKKLILD